MYIGATFWLPLLLFADSCMGMTGLDCATFEMNNLFSLATHLLVSHMPPGRQILSLGFFELFEFRKES
jgi:hypothetical protein